MSSNSISALRAPSTAVVRLLGQHYGDRSVYLRDPSDRALLQQARSRGLVSIDGMLTTAGYRFWQYHQQD